MAKQRNRRPPAPAGPTPFEESRDELFQHIIRCGVIGAEPEHVEEWFNETMRYLEERYPELSTDQLRELRVLGTRFAQPPKERKADPNAASAA
ncbi:MAG: hypothetical protein ABR499_13855 [Gemmatimonadaceae bacterium]